MKRQKTHIAAKNSYPRILFSLYVLRYIIGVCLFSELLPPAATGAVPQAAALHLHRMNHWLVAIIMGGFLFILLCAFLHFLMMERTGSMAEANS